MRRRTFLTLATSVMGSTALNHRLQAEAIPERPQSSRPRPEPANVWRTAAPVPITTQEIYPAVHQGKLIVAGGIAPRLGVPYFTRAVFAYDADSDTWSRLPDLPEALHHVALVSTGEELWAMGGFHGAVTHIWKMRDNVYRLRNDRWETLPPLPGPQAEGVATFHSGTIHIVTGQQPRGTANRKRSDHQEMRLHWYWDGTGWDSLAPLPTPRNSATGGWIDNQLVVAGGRTSAGNLSTNEIYDAKEDRWRRASPMPLPQAGTASVVHNGSLLVFGGEIFSPEPAVFPNVWRYQLETDRWEAMPDMLTPRHGLGAGLIGNQAFVVGGARRPSGEDTSNVNEVLDLG